MADPSRRPLGGLLRVRGAFDINALLPVFVITGLDPVIQKCAWGKRCLDCRITSGNDDKGLVPSA